MKIKIRVVAASTSKSQAKRIVMPDDMTDSQIKASVKEARKSLDNINEQLESKTLQHRQLLQARKLRKDLGYGKSADTKVAKALGLKVTDFPVTATEKSMTREVKWSLDSLKEAKESVTIAEKRLQVTEKRHKDRTSGATSKRSDLDVDKEKLKKYTKTIKELKEARKKREGEIAEFSKELEGFKTTGKHLNKLLKIRKKLNGSKMPAEVADKLRKELAGTGVDPTLSLTRVARSIENLSRKVQLVKNSIAIWKDHIRDYNNTEKKLGNRILKLKAK